MPGKHNTPFQMKGTPFQRNFGISPVKQDKRTGIMPEVKSKKVKSNMPFTGELSRGVKSNTPTTNTEIPQKKKGKGKHTFAKTKTTTKSSKPSTKKSWQQTVNEKRKAGIGYETTIKRGKDGKVTSSGITFSDGTYLAD